LNEILTAVAEYFAPHPSFNVTYDVIENTLVITQGDIRSINEKIDTPILLRFLTDDELKTGPSKIADPLQHQRNVEEYHANRNNGT
jgi:hypothetical protein